MSLELRKERHFWECASVRTSAVLVDARAYYRAFYWSALRAERYLLIAGWQFDSEVALLRGDDANGAPLPVTFLAFLDALCARRPELKIYVLAWDYSFVYALEREWLQSLKFAIGTPGALRFEFDTHPRADGSHHQKFVVVDGQLAFAGGLDLCDARWDDPSHAPDAPLRVNVAGEACRPNHEVQAAISGEAALRLAALFCERWRAACDETLSLPAPPAERSEVDFGELTGGVALPLRAERVCLSRTGIAADGTAVTEIRATYEDALRSAESLVYIENQYFTSRSIAAALLARFDDRTLPKLTVIVMLPKGADSGKEKFALGEVQGMVLGALEAAARAKGHELIILCSGSGDDEHATFIHSKLLLVDDCFLSVGSANMTERSMGIDTELALSFQAPPGSPLAGDIARVRATLLAEHAGGEPSAYLPVEGLFQRITALASDPASRLGACHYEPQTSNPLKTLMFDPGDPLTLPELEESATDEERERLSYGSGELRRRLARRSAAGE